MVFQTKERISYEGPKNLGFPGGFNRAARRGVKPVPSELDQNKNNGEKRS